MTRFIFLSDSHIGTTPVAFQQQPAAPERIRDLLTALQGWIDNDGGIDFIIHGGDMVDIATRDNIRRAAAAFQLSVPVYLCLGNHDLNTPDALDVWLSEAPHFFIDSSPTYSIEHEGGRILVMPNQWGSIPFYWEDEQRPRFTAEQHAWVEQDAAREDHADVHLFVTHSPVHGIPAAQTGFSEPYHNPDPAFAAEIADIAARYTGIRCVAGAHNHINSSVDTSGLRFVTVSSFVESPFEFKLFEIERGVMQMTTHTLAPFVSFPWTYDFERTFVQGRACDRAFRIETR